MGVCQWLSGLDVSSSHRLIAVCVPNLPEWVAGRTSASDDRRPTEASRRAVLDAAAGCAAQRVCGAPEAPAIEQPATRTSACRSCQCTSARQPGAEEGARAAGRHAFKMAAHPCSLVRSHQSAPWPERSSPRANRAIHWSSGPAGSTRGSGTTSKIRLLVGSGAGRRTSGSAAEVEDHEVGLDAQRSVGKVQLRLG